MLRSVQASLTHPARDRSVTRALDVAVKHVARNESWPTGFSRKRKGTWVRKEKQVVLSSCQNQRANSKCKGQRYGSRLQSRAVAQADGGLVTP